MNHLTGSCCLVTGGAGFIGSTIVDQLLGDMISSWMSLRSSHWDFAPELLKKKTAQWAVFLNPISCRQDLHDAKRTFGSAAIGHEANTEKAEDHHRPR